MESTILSFVILDDLCSYCGPYYLDIGSKTKINILKGVNEIQKKFINSDKNNNYFTNYYFGTYHDSENVSDALYDNDYFVMNRFEKYYVIAFALNYTRFEVFSKDCDKELISWAVEGPIKGIIKDDDYNENPVIKLFKKI